MSKSIVKHHVLLDEKKREVIWKRKGYNGTEKKTFLKDAV